MMGGSRVHVKPVTEPRETLAENTNIKNQMNWKPTMKIEDWIKTHKEKMEL